MVDHVFLQEEKELEALISQQEEVTPSADNQSIIMKGYGSEDEDYDGLFMQLVSDAREENKKADGLLTSQTNTGSLTLPTDPDQAMDTSVD